MKRPNQITLSDVAKAAGVSPSTVSRVISDSPKISQSTKEKVLKCMDELGYYPNAIAQSLAKKRTGNIGVIMPSRAEDVLLNPFFPEALRGILKGASNKGYDILLSTHNEKDDELEHIKNFIRGSKVDGIVLMSSKVNDKSIEYLCKIDFPFSLIGSPYNFVEIVNNVDNDNYMATYELTMYLTMMGKRRIAMIVGDEELIVTRKRVEGYKRALKESNISYNDDLLFIGNFDEKTGHRYGRELLKIDPRPDALIATDDLVAFGAIQVFENLNIAIPEDIAVASFNNSIISRHSNIPFTSVDIDAYKLGEEAINLLVEAMKKEIRGKKTIIPYKIYKRQSTEKL